MKAWCSNCDATREASFRAAKDYHSGHSYEDLCCDDCHFVIATVCDRENTADQLKQAKVDVLREAAAKFHYDCDCGCPCDCYGPSTAKFQLLTLAQDLEDGK